MTRTAFRKADIARAIEAAVAAGFTVAAVEILPDGTIRILNKAAEPLTPAYIRELNPWDHS